MEKDLKYTPSGIPIKVVYTPDDTKDISYEKNLSNPGSYPYTRGLYPRMYRHFPWVRAELSGFGLPEETNERQKYLLKEGQRGYSDQPIIHICFDLGTQYGYESDNPLVKYDVGNSGVIINSLKDMELLLDGLPLDRLYTSLIIDTPAPILLAMYIVVAEKMGISRNKLDGALENDAFKGYICDNMGILPPEATLRLKIETMKFCIKEMPNFIPMAMVGYNLRESGATAIQEIAFSISMVMEIVKAGVREGLKVDEFAPNFIVWFFSLHNNFFEEICKIRAARRIWAKIMKEKFGAKNPKSLRMKIWTQTAGSTLTAKEPLNNISRVTIQALAGVLAGVQGIHACCYDEAIGLPTEESVRVALRTQQIIEHESGIPDVADPLGGSYFVESLTDEIERRVMEYIEKIEDMGGYIEGIKNGYMKREILEASKKYQMEIESGNRVIVGVNRFVSDIPINIESHRPNPDAYYIAVERLHKLKKERDNKRVKEVLNNVRKNCENNNPLMPTLIEAVKEYATIGEIMDIFREVYGEYREEN